MHKQQVLELSSNLSISISAQSLVEYFFWETYQDCAREVSDLRHTELNKLILLVRYESSPLAQVLYRLAYAIFSYAITSEQSYLETEVQQCFTELKNLQAEYSLVQISKYLSKYMTQQYGLAECN